jgi:acyl carrier protein
MPDVRERLTTCFLAVFPDLTTGEVERAGVDRTAAWDSVATTTLAAVVEEEFGIQFEPQAIEKLDSFQAFLSALCKRRL